MLKKFCRFCNHPLHKTFCDLGKTPFSNSFLSSEEFTKGEPVYPLHAFVCSECLLVQVDEFEKPHTIFSDYAYFSSFSDSWLDHAKKYTHEMIARFGFSPRSQIVEIASNDGYLLQYFLERKFPVLGIEPAKNVAAFAQSKGIETLVEFFGTELAKIMKNKGTRADLLIANNVLAHVPDLNDFVEGIKINLSPSGMATLEFPHLLKLIQENQFDTIYHEHFSYFSFFTVEKIFHRHGMKIFDVESLPTHGGSLRIFVSHEEDLSKAVSNRVANLRTLEKEEGLLSLDRYTAFDQQAKNTKKNLLTLLTKIKNLGQTLAAYGAPAKGNTLLNYCGIRSNLIDFTVDRSPHKQGKLLPGSHIPIYATEKIRMAKPDYVLILPWNLKEEIMTQLSFIQEWKGKFIVPIPEPVIL